MALTCISVVHHFAMAACSMDSSPVLWRSRHRSMNTRPSSIFVRSSAMTKRLFWNDPTLRPNALRDVM